MNVIKSSKGVKITGKGIPDETADQVDTLSKQKSSGGSSKSSGGSKKTKTSNNNNSNSDQDNLDKAFETTQGTVYGF